MLGQLKSSHISCFAKRVRRPCRILQTVCLGTSQAGSSPTSVIPDDGTDTQENFEKRRQWVEQYTGSNLKNVMKWWKGGHMPDVIKACDAKPIGLAKVPLAVAGPLRINGQYARGNFLAPLATTEGALVASVNRGAATINKAGGIKAYTSQLRVRTCPVFEAHSPQDAALLGDWVQSQRGNIQQKVVSHLSPKVSLREIIPVHDHQYVHILLNYEGDDIQYADMCTVSSEVAGWIADQAPPTLQLKRYWKESLLSGRKKASRLNMILGSGLSCGAEVVLTEEILNRYLNVSAEDMKIYYNVTSRSGDRSSSMASNANTANVTSAMFVATGQDLGLCVDSSTTKHEFIIHEGQGGGIKKSIWIPSLVVQTQHGGADLPSQRQCLEMMGCYGPEKVRKLGEIVASFAVALEISTFCALVAGEFSKAHEKLGKNRPK